MHNILTENTDARRTKTTVRFDSDTSSGWFILRQAGPVEATFSQNSANLGASLRQVFSDSSDVDVLDSSAIAPIARVEQPVEIRYEDDVNSWLWKFVDELEATLTDEDLKDVPTDLASRHDYYLYGVDRDEIGADNG